MDDRSAPVTTNDTSDEQNATTKTKPPWMAGKDADVPTMFRRQNSTGTQGKLNSAARAKAAIPKSNGDTAESLEKEVQRKVAAKYDNALESKLQGWIEGVVGEPFTQPFPDELKNGRVLCKLINKLQPGSVKKISESNFAFKQMENITTFLRACKGFGVNSSSIFDTAGAIQEQGVCELAAVA